MSSYAVEIGPRMRAEALAPLSEDEKRDPTTVYKLAKRYFQH